MISEGKKNHQIRQEDLGIGLNRESKDPGGLQVFKISVSPLPTYIIVSVSWKEHLL